MKLIQPRNRTLRFATTAATALVAAACGTTGSPGTTKAPATTTPAHATTTTTSATPTTAAGKSGYIDGLYVGTGSTTEQQQILTAKEWNNGVYQLAEDVLSGKAPGSDMVTLLKYGNQQLDNTVLAANEKAVAIDALKGGNPGDLAGTNDASATVTPATYQGQSGVAVTACGNTQVQTINKATGAPLPGQLGYVGPLNNVFTEVPSPTAVTGWAVISVTTTEVNACPGLVG